jgi:PadR family transcriptional regulator AphA
MSTTSYAILGLLAVRPWSAYELAKQMERSFSFIWPRAKSAIYEEPKHLVAEGLARASEERRGRQRRTRYTITARGRRELRKWLAEPSAPPQFESEAAVRMMFADHGSKDDILATVEQLEAHAQALNEQLLGMARDYLDGVGPFPERSHVNAAVGRLCHEYVAGLLRWTAWAKREIATWPSTGPEAARFGDKVMADNLRDFGCTLHEQRALPAVPDDGSGAVPGDPGFSRPRAPKSPSGRRRVGTQGRGGSRERSRD